MGDAVQVVLEAMVPELEHLQEVGVLGATEIRSLVAARKDFEYKLQRRTAIKADYIRYIEYELKFEALRKKRRTRLGIHEVGASDHAFGKRVCFIYERALRKFKGDIALWVSAFDFALQVKAYKVSSRLFARALQLHPRVEQFWVRAAANELDNNSSVSGARQLMQRGLRVNKTSHVLWHEYFRLEFLFLFKVRGRRAVLGVDDDDDDAEDSQNDKDTDETTEDSGAAPGGPGGRRPTKLHKTEDQLETEKTREQARQVFVQGATLEIVFRNAVKAVPDNLAFQFGFVEIARLFLDGQIGTTAASVLQKLVQSIRENFPQSAELYDHLAALLFALCNEQEAAVATEALRQNESVPMPSQTNSKKRPRPQSAATSPRQLVLTAEAVQVEAMSGSKAVAKLVQSLSSDARRRACEILLTGCERVPGHASLDYFIEFATSSIAELEEELEDEEEEEEEEEEDNARTNQLDANKLRKLVCAVVKQSVDDTVVATKDNEDDSKVAVSMKACCAWVDACSDSREALRAVNQGLEMHPSSSLLWRSKLEHIRETSSSPSRALSSQEFKSVLAQAVRVVAPADSLELRLVHLDALVRENHADSKARSIEDLIRAFVDTVAELSGDVAMNAAPDSPGATVLAGLLAWAQHMGGVEMTRKATDAMLKRGIPTCPPESFFAHVLDVELAQAAGEEAATQYYDPKRVRMLFERALSAHEHSPDMWLRYVLFEREVSRDARREQSLLWRARKAVEDVCTFELRLVREQMLA